MKIGVKSAQEHKTLNRVLDPGGSWFPSARSARTVFGSWLGIDPGLPAESAGSLPLLAALLGKKNSGKRPAPVSPQKKLRSCPPKKKKKLSQKKRTEVVLFFDYSCGTLNGTLAQVLALDFSQKNASPYVE